MMLADYHVHSTFCDGKNTPEEMVQAALQKGLVRLGFSGHGHTDFDPRFCMSEENEVAYRAEIARLKTAYAESLEILCGVEQDYFGGKPNYPYDYIIGSVHYLKVGDTYLSVDGDPDGFVRDVQQYFGGDYIAYAEAYYALIGDVAEQTGATIVGHFDLVTKFNEGQRLFSEADPRYVAAWQAAADRLIAAGVTFEINTGAISRGYRTAPYPAPPILEYLKAHGVPLVLTGDTHAAENLCYQFETWEHLLK